MNTYILYVSRKNFKIYLIKEKELKTSLIKYILIYIRFLLKNLKLSKYYYIYIILCNNLTEVIFNFYGRLHSITYIIPTLFLANFNKIKKSKFDKGGLPLCASFIDFTFFTYGSFSYWR